MKIIDAAVDFAALSHIASVQPGVDSRSFLKEVFMVIIRIVQSSLSIALLGSPEKESAAYESCASTYSNDNSSYNRGIAVAFLRAVNSIGALVWCRGTVRL